MHSDNLPPKLEFDLSLDSVPVTLKSPKTGFNEHYVLREATGQGRNEYLTHISKRLKMDPGAQTGQVTDFSQLQSKLLNHCLMKKVPPKDMTPEVAAKAESDAIETWAEESVSMETIESWPSSVQEKLFQVAQNMSGLEQNKQSAEIDALLKDESLELTEEEKTALGAIADRIDKKEDEEAKNG